MLLCNWQIPIQVLVSQILLTLMCLHSSEVHTEHLTLTPHNR